MVRAVGAQHRGGVRRTISEPGRIDPSPEPNASEITCTPRQTRAL